MSKRLAAFYAALAATILLPALKPGQLFLLDMPWPDNFYLDSYTAHGISAQFPLMVVLHLLNLFIPAWLLQKILLLSVLTFAGIGMFLLQKTLSTLSTHPNAAKAASLHSMVAIASGTLYMLNPFVLDRLVAGQWLVLAGYAFMPFFLRLAWVAYHNRTPRNVAWALGAWAVFPIFSVHFWYIATLFLLPVAAHCAYTYLRSARRRKPHVTRAAAMAGGALGVWLIILAARYDGLTRAVGAPDFAAFATRSIDVLGAWGAVLSLRGFWYSSGTVPGPLEPLWLVMCGVFVALTVYTIATLRRTHPRWGLYAAAAFAAAVVLAAGYGSPLSQWVTDAVRHIVPGYSGLRETQKIAGVIALIYALAVPHGIRLVLQKYKHVSYRYLVLSVGIIAYCLCMVFALAAVAPKLKPYRYPAEWHQVTETLYYAIPHRVLILPWNGYIHVPFANNTFMANPAARYFNAPADTRPNSGNKILDGARGDSKFDYAVLSLKKGPNGLVDVRAKGYDYILLLHTEDYLSYKKTLDKADIQPVFDGADLTLYSTKQYILDQSF